MATVLILGATSDIGVAIAKKFASEKFDLLLAARKPEQLKPLESDIHIRYGANCSSLAFNALEYESHAAFFNSIHPKPDVSICVFGLLEDEEKAFDDWELTKRMIDTNYTGCSFNFECYCKILHHPKKRNHNRDKFCCRRPRTGE